MITCSLGVKSMSVKKLTHKKAQLIKASFSPVLLDTTVSWCAHQDVRAISAARLNLEVFSDMDCMGFLPDISSMGFLIAFS